MKDQTTHPELEADRRADRRTYFFFGVFLFASFIVLSMSDQHDLTRVGADYPTLPWVAQATSHAVVLALTPFITLMLNRFPLSDWRRSLPAHIGAVVIFSALHIAAMVALRKLLVPVFIGVPYEFGLADPSVWLYEFRKDILSYALIATLFATNRMAEQRALEAGAVRTDASERHRLTLKSGGRTYFVNVSDVISVKAASNYVEVVTASRTYLARSTLGEVEKLLQAAGGRHRRVHRSHIIDLDRVTEITPTGEGDAVLTLETGDEIPGSRRFRDAFAAAG